MNIDADAWAAAVRVASLFRPTTAEERVDVWAVLVANLHVEQDRRRADVSHPNLAGALSEKREKTSLELNYEAEQRRLAQGGELAGED